MKLVIKCYKVKLVFMSYIQHFQAYHFSFFSAAFKILNKALNFWGFFLESPKKTLLKFKFLHNYILC